MADFAHSLRRTQPSSNKISNGNAFTSKNVYEDVFGGASKFEIPTFSSRVEDYSEIFSSYNSSRCSSIPFLDLPDVDETGVSTDVRSSEFDYSEIFGGFDSVDYAVPYEELFLKPKAGESSSEDVWTPAQTGSPSEESSEDPACSENNQAIPNIEPQYAYDGVKQFKMSYHKTNQISKEDGISGTTHIAQLNAVPAFTFVVDDVPFQTSKCGNSLTDVVNDHSLNAKITDWKMDGEHFWETTPAKPVHGSDQKPQQNLEGNGTCNEKPFLSISDISLRTQPSEVPPPSRPPPKLTIKQGSYKLMASDLKPSPNSARQGAASDSSPPFFDVEIDLSSSAAASAAAMKEAMEKAQARLKSAKELMEKKKDGLQHRKKMRMKEESKGNERREGVTAHDVISVKEEKSQVAPELEVKPRLFNVSKESVDHKYPKESRLTGESQREEVIGEWKAEEQFYELVKKDTGGTVLVAPEHKKGDRNSIPTTRVCDHEKNENKAEKVASLQQEKRDLILQAAKSEWEEDKKRLNVTKEACERAEHEEKIKAAQKIRDQVVHKERQKEADELKESEVKLKEVREREERENKLKGTREQEMKEAHEREEYEKKLKEAHERVEHEKKLNEGREREKKRNDALQREENERIQREACEREENDKKEALEREEDERRQKEAREKEENEKRINEKKRREASEREENERRQREAREKEENEKRINEKKEKEARQREENERRQKEAREKEENEMRQKEVREWEENERRQKEECEREENEKRINEKKEKEARQTEENERRQKEAYEREENERKQKEEREREEYERKLKQVAEENERRLKEVREREENERKQNEECEREENEKRLKEAYEREETERKLKQDAEENERRLKEVHEQKENEKIRKEAHDWEENEKRPKEPCEEVVSEKLLQKETCERLEIDQHQLSQDFHVCNEEDKNLSAEAVFEEITGCENKLKAGNDAYMQDEIKNSKAVCGGCEQEENNRKLKMAQELCKNEDYVETMRTAQHAVEHRDNVKNSKEDKVSCEQDENEMLRGAHITQSSSEHEEYVANQTAAPKTKVDDSENKSGEIEAAEEKCTKEDLADLDRKDRKKSMKASPRVGASVEARVKIEVVQPTNEEEKITKPKLAGEFNTNQEKKGKNLNGTVAREGSGKEGRVAKEREQEKERLRKLEEDRQREREREKDRMAVERVTREARERAYVEARERAERAAVERATAEARQRAMTEARERLEKACAEARDKSLAEKASTEAKLRAERATVERAIAEARERAVEKAMSERAAMEARERVERSGSEKFSATSRDSCLRQSVSFSDLRDTRFQSSSSSSSSQRYPSSSNHGAFTTDKSQGTEVESAQRCKARLERHQRAAERAAKALAEKNLRDHLAQREQAERNRLAETLDADVKRWSSGKEGNLRALLSTLQYILGAESGWQPVPLTDVITAVAVKKAYRKATLYVHPDKLQQRGASIQQKYICEKVFDLLKDAWNKFNSEER